MTYYECHIKELTETPLNDFQRYKKGFIFHSNGML